MLHYKLSAPIIQFPRKNLGTMWHVFSTTAFGSRMHRQDKPWAVSSFHAVFFNNTRFSVAISLLAFLSDVYFWTFSVDVMSSLCVLGTATSIKHALLWFCHA
jgi:hypothetical protein